MSSWLVVHTQPNNEERAEHHLRRQSYGVYLPRYGKMRRHARKTERVIRPLFPRYLFVEFEPDTTPWRAIQSTVGVSQLVLAGDRPLVADQNIINELRQREDEDGLIVLGSGTSLNVGQRVRVTDGPFCDHAGLFESVDDNERAIILIDLLGRSVRARFPMEALAAVS